MSKYEVKKIVDSISSNYSGNNNCLDIETQLTQMLSEKIAGEIDREILKAILEPDRKQRRKKSIQKILDI